MCRSNSALGVLAHPNLGTTRSEGSNVDEDLRTTGAWQTRQAAEGWTTPSAQVGTPKYGARNAERFKLANGRFSHLRTGVGYELPTSDDAMPRNDHKGGQSLSSPSYSIRTT